MTLRLNGSSSGYTEIDAPAAAGSNTLVLPTGNGSAGNFLSTDGSGVLSWSSGGRMVVETAKSASGTLVDFTGIPSWARRVTVALDSISTLSTGVPALRLGTSSSVENTGYTSSVSNIASTVATQVSATSGFELITTGAAAHLYTGLCQLINITGNIWVLSGTSHQGTANNQVFNGRKTLASVLTRVQLTTTAGTDQFDGGTINILYEG